MLLTLAMPFYLNSSMLALQYGVWAGYPPSVKAAIEVVLVDDGSPEPAADVPRPDGLPALRIFRVTEDRPWHQHGARNLAADQAAGTWLLMTDMDHVVPAETMAAVIEVVGAQPQHAWLGFRRLDAPDLKPKLLLGQPHPHQNTFVCSKARYWAIGGYDEDCTGYGTDGFFLRRLRQGPGQQIEAPVIRYPREVVKDASTRAPAGLDPKQFRDNARRTAANNRILAEKAERGLGPRTLQFAWERVL